VKRIALAGFLVTGSALWSPAPAPASAADAIDGCDAPRTEPARTTCARADLEKAEAELSWQFERSIETTQVNDEARPDPGGIVTRESRLRSAQDAWRIYRDAHCDSLFLASVASELEEVNKIWCRTRLTRERREQLAETTMY
jgi:uncharacterized protein YecT (DUF1311 family)